MWKQRTAEERAEAAEWWSGRATILILAGILLEIFLLIPERWLIWRWIEFLRQTVDSEFWGPATANGLIGIGLFMEYVCIRVGIRASREIKIESDRKVAEALDRAAKAETDLLEYRLQRRLKIRPHIDSLSDTLKQFAGTQFDIGFDGSGEADDCASEITKLLKTSGWVQLNWGAKGPLILSSGTDRGTTAVQDIVIHCSKETLRAGSALESALKEVGVEAKVMSTPFVFDNSSELNLGLAMHILVGRKT